MTSLLHARPLSGRSRPRLPAVLLQRRCR
uniref:Uncharacterized protein n=1 Tax=Arundo donax TaxID=35708 RepID=A0A0A9G227_ARUDO